MSARVLPKPSVLARRSSALARKSSVLVLVSLLGLIGGCGPAQPEVRAVAGGMDCAEVAEIIDEAIERGQRFVAGQEQDEALAADLVFALSGAEERPECVDEAVRSRAEGLRATLVGTSG